MLPTLPRRAWLRSFGLVAAVLGGIPLVAAGTIWQQPWLAGAGLALGLASVVVAAVRPTWLAPAYAGWNRLADFWIRGVRLVVKAVCFYIIILIVGRTGSSLQLGRVRSGSSLWQTRGEAGVVRGVRPAVSSWGWAVQSGSPWIIVLVPFLAVLARLEPDDRPAVPTSTYTLY